MVFEISNHTLREVYLGKTDKQMHEVIAAVRRAPPRAVRHWKKDHELRFRSIEFVFSRRDAEDFLRAHVPNHGRADWKIFPAALPEAKKRERSRRSAARRRLAASALDRKPPPC